MADSDKTEHISDSIMERFSVRSLSGTELASVARHLTGCPGCQAEFVSTLRRQRGAEDFSFALAPEFWLRHEHLDYERLVEFAENKLEPTDRELIDAHLKVCPPCEEDVRSFLAFREQIEPELNVSYVPLQKKPDQEPLSRVSWWRSWTWKPAYSAMLLVIGIALLIGGALLLNRDGGNQRAQQSPTPQVSPGSTPDERAARLPSPPVSASESPSPTGAGALVVLNDGSATITVDKSGNVSGLDDLSASTRDEIAQVLLTERLDPPSSLKELRGQESGLRGSNSKQPFKLTYPSRTVILSDRPSLKWEKAAGARSYRVYINDLGGHEVARSEDLPPEIAEWDLPTPLKRGEVYVWTVVALVDGKEIVSPGSAASEMKFKILSRKNLQELNLLKQNRSHLALGIFYTKVGLLTEAELEFQQLTRLNPNSKVATNLLHKARSLRRQD